MPVTIRRSDVWFFDQSELLRKVAAARVKVMSKQGAYLRRTMRGLLRVSKHASKPGSPPHVRSAASLLRLIIFAYDDSTSSVVVGPIGGRRHGTSGDGRSVDRSGVPETLEYGGRVSFLVARWRGKVRRLNTIPARVDRRKLNIETLTKYIQPRPYVSRTLQIEMKKLPGFYRDALLR